MRTAVKLTILMAGAVVGLQCGSNAQNQAALPVLAVFDTTAPLTKPTHSDARTTPEESEDSPVKTLVTRPEAAAPPETAPPEAPMMEVRVEICHKSVLTGRIENIFVPIEHTTSFLRQANSYLGHCRKNANHEWQPDPDPNDRCSTTWGIAVSCDDDNTCTTDGCDTKIGCTYTPLHDGYACKNTAFPRGINTICREGHCVPDEKTSCDDNNPRTEDLIDPDVPHCIHKTISASLVCDDSDPRTVDSFNKAGECQHIVHPKTKNHCEEMDNDPCTTPMAATINGENLCIEVQSHDGTACNDHRECTQHDVCIKGICTGTLIDCTNEKNVCTGSYCDETSANCVEFPSLKIADHYLNAIADGEAPSDFQQCDLKGSLRSTAVLRP